MVLQLYGQPASLSGRTPAAYPWWQRSCAPLRSKHIYDASTSTEGGPPGGLPHRVQGSVRDWRVRPVHPSIPSLSFHSVIIHAFGYRITCSVRGRFLLSRGSPLEKQRVANRMAGKAARGSDLPVFFIGGSSSYYAWRRSYTLATCYMRRRVPGGITPPTAMEGLRQPAATRGDHTNQQPTFFCSERYGAGIHV